MKGGGLLGKTSVTVLTEKHLAGRRLSPGKEEPGFTITTAMTEKKQNDLTEKQLRSTIGQENGPNKTLYEVALARSGTMEEMQKYLKSLGGGVVDNPDKIKMSEDFVMGEYGSEKEIRDYLASGQAGAKLGRPSYPESIAPSEHSFSGSDSAPLVNTKESSPTLSVSFSQASTVTPSEIDTAEFLAKRRAENQGSQTQTQNGLTSDKLAQFVIHQKAIEQKVNEWLNNGHPQFSPEFDGALKKGNDLGNMRAEEYAKQPMTQSPKPVQEEALLDLAGFIAKEEVEVHEMAKSQGYKMGAKIKDGKEGEELAAGSRALLASNDGERTYIHSHFPMQQTQMRVSRLDVKSGSQ